VTKSSARGEIIKINGANVNLEEIDIEFVKSCHNNSHIGLSDADLVAANFCRSLKTRVTIELDKSVQQIFQEEQSKLIKTFKNLDVVADALPQYKEVQSGLYKRRNKSIPLIPESRADIKLDG
jgi:hypothetical protein